MQTSEYLDAARSRAGIPSDYALAARLGVSRGAVSNWRVGRGFPEPLYAFRLAELADVDPARLVADLELQRAEREHRDATAAGWRSILQRISGAAAAVVMVAGLGAVPSPSQASGSQPRVNPDSSLYIMLTCKCTMSGVLTA
jgi:transcriptional regulator with XRE-family HTH domain